MMWPCRPGIDVSLLLTSGSPAEALGSGIIVIAGRALNGRLKVGWLVICNALCLGNGHIFVSF